MAIDRITIKGTPPWLSKHILVLLEPQKFLNKEYI